jgi:hypothetical protein
MLQARAEGQWRAPGDHGGMSAGGPAAGEQEEVHPFLPLREIQ